MLKMAWNEHSAQMKWLLPPAATSVADIPSFPAFHRFPFGSLTATESRNFIQFPLCSLSPTAVFCGWNSYPIYHGSSREKCPCLSDFWCKEMEESPDSVFQAPGLGWCQPLKERRQHGGDTGRGPQRPSCSVGLSAPSWTLGMKKEMNERTLSDESL